MRVWKYMSPMLMSRRNDLGKFIQRRGDIFYISLTVTSGLYLCHLAIHRYLTVPPSVAAFEGCIAGLPLRQNIPPTRVVYLHSFSAGLQRAIVNRNRGRLQNMAVASWTINSIQYCKKPMNRDLSELIFLASISVSHSPRLGHGRRSMLYWLDNNAFSPEHLLRKTGRL